MDDLKSELVRKIESVYAKLNLIEPEQFWNEQVKQIIVILSASRSGSSVIFNALVNSPGIVAPAGEHEPWLTLSYNKFPFSDSDQIINIKNKSRLLTLIRNDLLIREKRVNSKKYSGIIHNRMVIRDCDTSYLYKKFLKNLNKKSYIDHFYHKEIEYILNSIKNNNPPCSLNEINNGAFTIPIENPPLITPPLARLATLKEISKSKLVFKSPSDSYRPGFYEALFPNANIKYIHLTRGFAQTVNGLMDGWQMNETDFISNPVGILNKLNIEDYSITDISKTYWCFDLFSGWQEYSNKSLLRICCQQWLRAHESIINNYKNVIKLEFEQFYYQPKKFFSKLSEITELNFAGHDWGQNIMATETPSEFRWLKRSTIFRNIDKLVPNNEIKQVKAMQKLLGYSNKERSWF